MMRSQISLVLEKVCAYNGRRINLWDRFIIHRRNQEQELPAARYKGLIQVTQKGRCETMFESLDDTIKHDNAADSSKAARFLRWGLTLALAVLLFSGLYLCVRLLE